MSTSLTRIVAGIATTAAVAAAPAVADAGSVAMRGVVSGSPYGASNGQMAVPVLFSKMTARNTGLKSPVGVIILKRTSQVKLPNGAGFTLPVNLRTGDRFKGFGVVGPLQKRVFYPRVVFSKPVVYFRSKELSLAELSAAIDSLRAALADLTKQFNDFKNATIAGFQSLVAQLSDLQKQLASLKSVDFQAQIDALNKKVNDLIASLPDFSKFALISQLPDLSGYAKLTDLTGFLKASDVTTMINNAIAALNLGQYAQQSALDAANATITTLQGQVTTLQGQVTTLQGDVSTLTSRLNTLCTALSPISGTLGAGYSTACP